MELPAVGPEHAQGERASAAGEPYTADPYAVGTRGWNEWLEGWLDAALLLGEDVMPAIEWKLEVNGVSLP